MGCSVCGEKVFARGLCQKHYWRLRRKGTLERTNVQRTEVCIIDGCTNEAAARNLCVKHYREAQHPLKHSWTLLRSRYPDQYPEAWNRFEKFVKDVPERADARSQLRRTDVSKPWSKSNMHWTIPVKRRDYFTKEERSDYGKAWQLNKRYGISLEQRARIIAEQGGGCSICGKIGGVTIEWLRCEDLGA